MEWKPGDVQETELLARVAELAGMSFTAMGMAGRAAAALPYYIHDAMHVRLSCSLSSITVGMISMPAPVRLSLKGLLLLLSGL